MFIQIMQGRCRDAHELREVTEEWREKQAPAAEGWLGGTYGVTDDGEFVGVVRFESREAATRNSSRPEQGEWWQRMASCFDGEVTFHDCDNAMLFLGGGSDDAGFVQVIQGRIEDPESFRHFMEQPMDAVPDRGAVPASRELFLEGRLQQLVAELPPQARMVMVLRYQEELDPAEIADALHMPVNTVKSHIRRSLAALRVGLVKQRQP